MSPELRDLLGEKPLDVGALRATADKCMTDSVPFYEPHPDYYVEYRNATPPKVVRNLCDRITTLEGLVSAAYNHMHPSEMLSWREQVKALLPGKVR